VDGIGHGRLMIQETQRPSCGVQGTMRRICVLSCALLTWPAYAWALLVGGPPPRPETARAHSTVVFMGIAQERRYAPAIAPVRFGHQEIRFQVLEDWKGTASDTICVTAGTRWMSEADAYGFVLGERYIVYASASSDSLYPFASDRGRTTAARYALTDLMGLGEGTPRSGYSPPKPPTQASLIDSLGSADAEMRSAAAMALASCDDQPIVTLQALAAMAMSGREGDWSADAALGEFGKRGSHRGLVEPVLRKVLDKARPSAQEGALRSMQGLVDDKTFRELVERALRKGEGAYLEMALNYAGRPPQSRAIRVRIGRRLLVLTKHRDRSIRAHALEDALEYPELRPRAKKIAQRMARKDRDEWVRGRARDDLRFIELRQESTPPRGC